VSGPPQCATMGNSCRTSHKHACSAVSFQRVKQHSTARSGFDLLVSDHFLWRFARKAAFPARLSSQSYAYLAPASRRPGQGRAKPGLQAAPLRRPVRIRENAYLFRVPPTVPPRSSATDRIRSCQFTLQCPASPNAITAESWPSCSVVCDGWTVGAACGRTGKLKDRRLPEARE